MLGRIPLHKSHRPGLPPARHALVHLAKVLAVMDHRLGLVLNRELVRISEEQTVLKMQHVFCHYGIPVSSVATGSGITAW